MNFSSTATWTALAIVRIAVAALVTTAPLFSAQQDETGLDPATKLLAQAEQSALGVQEETALGLPAGPPREGAELERVTETVSSDMRCPVCQGLSIADSPSDMARDMREKVRDLLAEGYSPDQVMVYFESTYGEFVRLQPKAQGFNLVVWIAPIAVLAIGLSLTALIVRGRTAKGARSAGAADPELDTFRERVRREVGS